MITRDEAIARTPRSPWHLAAAAAALYASVWAAAGLCILWDHRDELTDWIHDLAPIRRT